MYDNSYNRNIGEKIHKLNQRYIDAVNNQYNGLKKSSGGSYYDEEPNIIGGSGFAAGSLRDTGYGKIKGAKSKGSGITGGSDLKNAIKIATNIPFTPFNVGPILSLFGFGKGKALASESSSKPNYPKSKKKCKGGTILGGPNLISGPVKKKTKKEKEKEKEKKEDSEDEAKGGNIFSDILGIGADIANTANTVMTKVAPKIIGMGNRKCKARAKGKGISGGSANYYEDMDGGGVDDERRFPKKGGSFIGELNKISKAVPQAYKLYKTVSGKGNCSLTKNNKIIGKGMSGGMVDDARRQGSTMSGFGKGKAPESSGKENISKRKPTTSKRKPTAWNKIVSGVMKAEKLSMKNAIKKIKEENLYK